MAYCGNCGNEVAPGSAFCGHCGQVVHNASSVNTGQSHSNNNSASSYARHSTSGTKASSSFVGSINDYIGNSNAVSLNWKDLFSAVGKKHTTEEAEDIFICGTSKTTPRPIGRYPKHGQNLGFIAVFSSDLL